MKLEDIHKIARTHGIQPEKMFKIELVRTIQIAEGNYPCFATAKDGICDRSDCCWREDCFEAASKE